MIACRTPCALEPDVSEANTFSLKWAARRSAYLWQPGYLIAETLGFAPRRRRRFALEQRIHPETEANRVPCL